MELKNAITDVPGILVGHAHDPIALTGCTVVLCMDGAAGGVDQRGGAPGTRETDAMHPMHIVRHVHGIVLSGGSAFGLDSATGAVRFLEERGVGFDVRVCQIPIVPAAILFDLSIGRFDIRPDTEMGYQACQNASANPPEEGNAGAGMGATVGKILGISQAMKSGIGTASEEIAEGLVVGAIVAVNAFGDVIDPVSGEIVAGARAVSQRPVPMGQPGYFADALEVMRTLVGSPLGSFATPQAQTVIGVVATNASLTKEEINKVAQMAHDGLARTIKPAHTMLDGDTIFALATGKWQPVDEKKVDVNIVGAFAAEVFSRAILRAVTAAKPAGGLPAAGEFPA
jgi:L-aminopeptidase/D-esterase-like protein